MIGDIERGKDETHSEKKVTRRERDISSSGEGAVDA